MIGFLRKMRSPKRPPRPDGEVRLRPRDCHSHVIPGVDDGSRSFEESLQMLRMLSEAGAKHVIATPHIFPGRYPNERETVSPPFEKLVRLAADAGLALSLELGAEHYLDDTLADRVGAGRAIAFGPERYLLFETPTGPTQPIGLFEVVQTMTEAGYTPLLAHVERYQWLRDEVGQEILEDLRCAGVRFQVNRTRQQTRTGKSSSRGRFIARLQSRGWVDEVGSDLHRATPDGRPT